MEKLEKVNCNLCGEYNSIELYSTKQYSNSIIGKVDINLVICQKCNFIYQNPQLTSEILEKHYEYNSSGDVFRKEENDTRANILLQERRKFIYDSISLMEINSICDVGGGTGALISSLKLPVSIKKFLVEPSSAIDKNRDTSIIKVKKRIEDIAKQKNLKFDLLMCISTLEHLKNPIFILNTFNELINDDGYLLIEVPNSLKPYNTFAEYFSYEHVNHFTHETLLAFLDKSGFSPIKIDDSKSVNTIRIVAKKKSLNHENLIKFFKDFQEEKNSFSNAVINKIKPFFESENIEFFCIYGAGEHTRFLIEKFDCLNHIEYFIDSDPKKWGKIFYGKKIISPSEMISLGIKNILISSHDFEKEIFNTIKKLNENINVITIYKAYT